MNYAFVVLLCASALLSTINAEQILYEAGAKKAADQLLTRTNIQEGFRLGQVVTRDYSFGPVTAISYIKITSPKGRKAGTAALTTGGVGSTTAAFTFTSKRSSGINAKVEIYGTP